MQKLPRRIVMARLDRIDGLKPQRFERGDVPAADIEM
jgi:hypothetical protein